MPWCFLAVCLVAVPAGAEESGASQTIEEQIAEVRSVAEHALSETERIGKIEERLEDIEADERLGLELGLSELENELSDKLTVRLFAILGLILAAMAVGPRVWGKAAAPPREQP